MPVILLGIAALLGLAIGSFLNVVVWRVPRDESVVRPASACPSCGHAIRARDNVPVVSWLLLRARCRDCGEPISVRYPAVELATCVLFVLGTWWLLGRPDGLWLLPVVWYLIAIGVALTLIDLDVHRLPDRIVLPSYVVVGVLLALASAGTGQWDALLRAAIGMAALWTFYFALVMIYPRGMGFGDVKLSGVLGMVLAWFGWGPLVVGAFAAFLCGGVFALGLVVLRRAGRKSQVPFGPWMLLGATIGVVAGQQIWDAYLRATLGG
ncbi:prepilin peptidase [Cellulomonas sp. zg-ZUI222]|uniref:Prepilin leader peptidase/N-methyltransferase n=1 Tax=Cellulomonas wangleii TaxID=2816956 RepID=A0ABX8D959_9CELL|nr:MULTISPECIES: A24 family peptidase [Cellulomonas]MBO0900371.1 prepilin peptidase [Cellulomonas sp. zg-ZUI22]MBO0922799.1 prepilin peptidase [Cellulomonas wangleii]MBO0926336.1 prepilin peptidase [Cellulomonas wangleii]QVI63979.1 prepilin peptidase [Cellulomonas wangleii]